MNKSTFILFVVIALVSLSACKSTKKISTSNGTVTATTVFEQLVKQQTNANWLDAQLKITYKDASMTQTANANVRMKKDSVVWISVKKLGFEIVRAQVTKDSVYFLDRFNQNYGVKDLEFLSKMYNLPASLETLQALLLGNPIFFSSSNWQLESLDQQHHLFARSDKNSDFWINKSNGQLQAMALQDGTNKLDLKLENYQLNEANQYFSYIRKIDVTSSEAENLNLVLEFTKVELNQPKTIRFEIPNNYTRLD
jgi:hypothetical protein